jgi:hypothetical protein
MARDRDSARRPRAAGRAASGVVDRTPKRPPLDWKLAVRRYREGWTIAEIARDAGYALQSVRNGLVKRGVPLRARRKAPADTRALRAAWRWMLARARGRTPAGRRVALHPTWRDFESFCGFARSRGWRAGRTLVRLDPEQGFLPGNVRFVARSEVARYTLRARSQKPRHSVTAFGETKGLMQWARDRRCRVSASVLSARLHRGMPPEQAIATPPIPGQRGVLPHPERKGTRVRRALDWRRARRLYESGMDLSHIARELGAARTGIRDALKRHGVPLRPPSDLTVTREGELLCRLWSSMRTRCSSPGDRLYRYAGARGLRVCREWGRFAAFREWALRAGWKPGLCLVRLYDRKGYSPGNCRFVTKREASRRVRKPSRTRAPYVLVTAFGETKGLTEWSRDPRCAVSSSLLAQRLRAGRRPEDALTDPPLISKRPAGTHFLTAFGETKSLARWLRDQRCKVRAFGLRYRLAQGMDPERAIATPAFATTERRGSSRPAAARRTGALAGRRRGRGRAP